MVMAKGLLLAIRLSPMTPLSAAMTDSRWGVSGLAPSSAASSRGCSFASRLSTSLAHQFCCTAHALVDHARDAASLTKLFATGRTQRAPHRLMHPLGNAGYAQRGLRGQLRSTPEVCSAQVFKWVLWAGLVMVGK